MFDDSDNKDQFSAHELFVKLKNDESIFINDEIYDLSMVTDKFDEEQLRECVQRQAEGDMNHTHQTYIDVIKGLLDE